MKIYHHRHHHHLHFLELMCNFLFGRDDLSSLALEEKPKSTKPVPSVQPQMITDSLILTPTPALLPHTHSPPKHGKLKAAPQGDSSDTDPEAPVAQQMLSFVMDDPDFDSEEEKVQKVQKVKKVRDILVST